MSLEALKKQVSAAQADAIQQERDVFALAERLRKQLSEKSKEKIGEHLDKFLEAIGYFHANNLLGKDIHKKSFNLDMVINRFNEVDRIDLRYVKASIDLYGKLLKAIDDCDDDKRKNFVNNIQMCIRGLLD